MRAPLKKSLLGKCRHMNCTGPGPVANDLGSILPTGATFQKSARLLCDNEPSKLVDFGQVKTRHEILV